MQLRQAEAALSAGQLDEAGRLLAEDDLATYLPAKQVTLAVAAALVERGQGHACHGDTLAGWRDLEAALVLSGETAALTELRRQLVASTLAEAERYLTADDATAALACLERLGRRNCDTAATRLLEQVAKRFAAAGRLMRQGDFAAAEAELSTAARLRPDLRSLENRLNQCRVQLAESRTHATRFAQAVDGGDWSAAAKACDRLLAIAPDNRAWHWLSQCHRSRQQLAAAQAGSTNRPPVNDQTPPPSADSKIPSPQSPAPNPQPGRRLIAWVDAVGGFLVCLGDQVILGQPDPTGSADVPILADLSRRHAVVRRDGEGYTLVPLQTTLLDGRRLNGPTPLVDGNQIELGDGVQLRFRRPHPLSATAVLDFVSRHRTRPKVDGVVLMAQTCVFSPRPTAHVACRDWPDEVILFRDGKNLACRTNTTLSIDGQQHGGRGPVGLNSRIQAGDFAITLEEMAI
jgi:tetratricopeptide (TPR) repeat protein